MPFADLVFAAARRRGKPLPPPGHPEALAGLDYAVERAVKEEAVASHFAEHRLELRPEPLVAAPLPRGYRATTKRRVFVRGGRVSLGFPGLPGITGVAPSRLDAPGHVEIYRRLLVELEKPVSARFAADLNWVIVRSAGETHALILNLRALNAAVVRRAKQIGEHLRASLPRLAAMFLYLDPTGSEYYLEARRPEGGVTWKRLFGPDYLQVAVEGRRLRFPPTAFSQGNEAMLPHLTAAARSLAGPAGDRHLIDLYCGYGLFAITLGAEAARVTGVEHQGPAVEAARGNARAAGFGERARFVAGRIDATLLTERLVEPGARPEIHLLDPPRQGTSAGVVEALAARRPERVVHVFCGADEMAAELARWRRAGYRADRAVPLDLFPGTAGVETMVLLLPAR